MKMGVFGGEPGCLRGDQRGPTSLCCAVRVGIDERLKIGRVLHARTDSELQAATDAMHTEWQGLKMDTRDAQLRRAVGKACN